MASSAAVFFRIIYATAYLFLHLLLLALLLISPGDIINQSRDRHDVASILIVAACSVFAILVVIFVFFLRLFLKRAVLNSIPRSWIPIEKGEVPKPVRNIISAGLSRSAAIAFVSRPRAVSDELLGEICPMLVAGTFVPGRGGDQEDEKQEDGVKDGAERINGPDSSRTKAARSKKIETTGKAKELGIDLPPCNAVWGEIEHLGWAPPGRRGGLASNEAGSGRGTRGGDIGGIGGEDMGYSGSPLDENASLQYSTVLAELPSLIEAKVMTLAPRDSTMPADPPTLDADAVALLERPKCMGMREYVLHLAGLGVIDMQAEVPAYGHGVASDGNPRTLGDVVSSFAALYEYARFSTRKLSYEEFGRLMHELATILRCMTSPDPSVLYAYEDDAYEADLRDSYSFSQMDSRSSRSSRPYYAEDSEDVEVAGRTSTSKSTSRAHSRTRRSSSQSRPYPQRGPAHEQHHGAQAHYVSSRLAQHHSRSQSASSHRSGETGMSTSSSGSISSSGNSQESAGTSRRHRPLQRQIAAPSTDGPSRSRTRQASSSRPHQPMRRRRRPSLTSSAGTF
ncbi:hypothetical protein SEPCBS119000_001163 [Sporothrix epigloea]|uniref:Defect at low temperature protein 1 n=1 Tax=Sporothrix epigloea TaxID=1892477 RepID=A0ABP0DCD9_9PEZI